MNISLFWQLEHHLRHLVDRANPFFCSLMKHLQPKNHGCNYHELDESMQEKAKLSSQNQCFTESTLLTLLLM
jgi:hypothetical protein